MPSQASIKCFSARKKSELFARAKSIARFFAFRGM